MRNSLRGSLPRSVDVAVRLNRSVDAAVRLNRSVDVAVRLNRYRIKPSREVGGPGVAPRLLDQRRESTPFMARLRRRQALSGEVLLLAPCNGALVFVELLVGHCDCVRTISAGLIVDRTRNQARRAVLTSLNGDDCIRWIRRIIVARDRAAARLGALDQHEPSRGHGAIGREQ